MSRLVLLLIAIAISGTAATSVQIGGASVPLLGTEPTHLSFVAQTATDVNVHLCLAVPKLSTSLFECINERTQRALDDADQNPITGDASKYKKAKLIVFVPGFGGFAPSAAFIVRLTKFAEKVVVVYHYQDKPEEKKLIRATSIDDLDLPASANVFTIGNPTHRRFLDLDQVVDLVIKAYSLMDADPNIGPVKNIQSVIIGHSQGSFAVTQARQRLEAASLSNVIGTAVTIGGGLGDSSTSVLLDGGAGAKALFQAAYFFSKLSKATPPEIKNYLKFCEDLSTGKIDVKPLRALVDLGVGSTMGKGNQKYCRPQFRLAGQGLGVTGWLAQSPHKWHELLKDVKGEAKTDGILPLELTLAGKKTLKLPFFADHGYHIEYSGVVDAIFGALAV